MTTNLHANWFPIASSTDLPKRHVYQAQLLGREFAVWRADDGFVNVWENRCLHRGVRLSIGINDGHELRCQYHGWRYANRTAGCTYIPAHPADAPARTICNNTYPMQEAFGLVWTGEEAGGALPDLTGFEHATVLRPIPVNAPFEAVRDAIRTLSVADWLGAPGGVAANSDASLTLAAEGGAALRLFVQPCDSNRSVIRALYRPKKQTEKQTEKPTEKPAAKPVPAGAARTALLQHYSFLMQELRDGVEQEAAKQEAPEPMSVVISKVPAELADIPAAGDDGRKAEVRVQLTRKEMTADGIAALRFEAVKGTLPTFQPGAHIDLHLQNGLIRQYSLTNGPGETGHYRIGVKLEPDSRGGSAYLHHTMREGDVVAVSAPRNNFPLRRDSVHTLFIAGGIGVTPVLSMARALHVQGLDFEFHYFVQSKDHAAFKPELDRFGASLKLHAGLSPGQTGAKLRGILANPGHARHAYVCGPGPMLDAALKTAQEIGWDDKAVHFEYFKNTTEIDDSSSFEIDLARSAVTLSVPAGKSILRVLRENGIAMGSSCEQGACGTCRCGVIKGVVNHQDVYLSQAEKNAGDVMMTCVSRAACDRLILDL